MANIDRRLSKIEKKLGVDKKTRIVDFLGMKMTFDEFKNILDRINGNSKGVLPSEDPRDSSNDLKVLPDV